jgi:hypothetical protein
LVLLRSCLPGFFPFDISQSNPTPGHKSSHLRPFAIRNFSIIPEYS